MFQTESSPARLGAGVMDPDKVTEKRPRECAHGGWEILMSECEF